MAFVHAYPRLVYLLAGGAALLILVPILVRVIEQPHLFSRADALARAQAILVPGASIVRGEPSAILAERLDAAIDLYRAGSAKRILLSGDNGEGTYDEVAAMAAYLEARGIPSQDVFLDRAGFDTFSSMYRARRVFGAQTLIVVTQDFHLPRAVFLARAVGIDASGYVAGSGGTIWDYIREIPATMKALLDIIGGRQPKYIGAPIPLAGRGNAAW